MSFRVVITRFDEDQKADLLDELSAELDLSRPEAEEILDKLPTTVVRGLDEEDAEDLADVLEDLGAKVRIVEVTPRKGRRPSEEYDDSEEDEEEPVARSRPQPKVVTSNRFLIVVGMILVGLLLGVVIMASIGEMPSLSCDAGHRGEGANPSLVQALQTFSERYARGFSQDDSAAHGNLSVGKRATLRENLVGPACYVWIGLSPQGSDLDLHLRQGSELITQDRGEDNFPVIRHCTQAASNLEVDVEMFGGNGDWVVQRYVLGADPGADPLEQMHKLYSSMFIANGEAVGDAVKLKQMGSGEERVISIPLDSEWCYAVLAVSQPGSDLDMAMENPQGQKIVEDNATDNYPVLRDICPQEPGEFKLRLMMYGGSSPVVYQLYRGKMSALKKGVGGGGGGGGSKAPAPLNIDIGQHQSSDASVASDDGGPASAAADGGETTEPQEPVAQPEPVKAAPQPQSQSINPSKK